MPDSATRLPLFERLFKLTPMGTNVRTEALAGLTTFMTMSYIIVVQPAILSDPSGAAMPREALITATCLSSAIACILMAFLANYPIALAPGMGENVYFSVIVCGAMGVSWQTALGAVFIAGVVFVILSFFGFREKLVNVVPESLKMGIAGGIGLFIALLGLCWAGIVTNSPVEGAPVRAGSFCQPGVWIAIFGTVVIAALMAWRVWGAILWGIILSALVALPFGLLQYKGGSFAPPDIRPILFKLDIVGALNLFMVVFVFFFMDLFDTVGTLIGVGEEGGFMKAGKLPRARQALMSDALGTVAGSLMGTSTVTSYIESATGIGQGGRTGLANVTTAVLFLLALFTAPVVGMVANAKPVVAPALIVVGALMLKGVARVKWDDITEAIPAYVSLVVIPLTMSIALGIALGFLTYTLLKVLTGRYRQCHWIIYLVDVLVVAYLIGGVG